MKVSLEDSARITSELWLATIRLDEEGKSSNVEEFVVTGGQLAFLKLLCNLAALPREEK